MTEHVTAELRKEEPSDFHSKLLQVCLSDIKRSRATMSKHYDQWDLQDQVYRGERMLDQDDVKQSLQDKPTKMVVPNTFAQVMTFTSFTFLLFKQNDKFFELKPSGSEDYGTKWRDCETVLQRDWARSKESKTLFQFLLDTARFGTAPLEVSWVKESTKIWVVPEEPTIQSYNGIPLQSGPQPGAWQEFLKFEGNRIRNVSPYRWFPDVSFPLSDFDKGDFCASEEDFTMASLRQLEKDGYVAGVEHIQGFPRQFNTDLRGGPSRFSFGLWPDVWNPETGTSPVVVSKHRRKLIPKKFELEPGKFLGEEEFPILYTVWVANDNRIIKCEPCAEWHQELGYGLGQFTPDMHRTVTFGLADLIYRLQDVISWFVNSHITSVRRVMQNRNIINPNLVNMKSYDGEGDIFLNKGVAGRVDPRTAVVQLPAQDVTAGHMGDVNVISQIIEAVTGANANLQGQMNSGRRSAQENRVQTAGAAGRMKMHAHLLWESGLSKVGNMMLSNSRQSLSQKSFEYAVGKGNDPAEMAQRYAAFKGTPEEIVCGDDYLVFDSTLSSEKGFMAQNMQELLSLVLQANPQAAVQITQKIDPTKIIGEMQYLRDGTPIERLYYDQGQTPMLPPTLVGPNGQPLGVNPAEVQPPAQPAIA